MQLVSTVVDLSSLKRYDERTTKPHDLIFSGATFYICSQNAFLLLRGLVRIWKSEGQDSEYFWFFSGLVWWLVLMIICHKLVTWVGSLTYKIIPDHLNSCGKTHSQMWVALPEPRWNMAEATLLGFDYLASSGHWVSLSCWPCCCYYGWH